MLLSTSFKSVIIMIKYVKSFYFSFKIFLLKLNLCKNLRDQKKIIKN